MNDNGLSILYIPVENVIDLKGDKFKNFINKLDLKLEKWKLSYI